ncbi:hypothetical protein ACFQ73_40420 [Amycolatopsis japonica]|uniref:hypothetical protein n=1 Tax=Amycolatopsis japonica TaxID=208439 RepID=UPI003671DD2D
MTITAPPAAQTRRARRDLFPSRPIPAAETALAELTISRSNGLAPMVGERTTLPGLVLTPHVTGEVLRYTGNWILTHARSGRRVSPAASFLHTREAVVWLENRGVDWDRPTADILADPAASSAFEELDFAMYCAQDAGRPLVYARTSWVDWPPLWRVHHRGGVSDEGFDTFEAAADVAWSACRFPGDEPGMYPSSVIRRDEQSPGWALRCASIACTDRDSFYVDAWDGDRPAVDSRAVLERMAWDSGWRGHGHGHWTCPNCTRQYPTRGA